MPNLSIFRRVVTIARRRALSLDRATALLISRELRGFINKSVRAYSSAETVSQESMDLAERAVREAGIVAFRNLVAEIGEARSRLFNEISDVWQQATIEALDELGLSNLAKATLKKRELTMLGTFETSGGAASWRTLLKNHISGAVGEANNIIRQGIVNGVPPAKVAKQLRRYVEGSQPFHELFQGEQWDFGKVPQRLRNQARLVDYRARRIAFTEIGNARAEAEVQHMAADPVIRAVKWRTSSNRGSARIPDECDILEQTDYFGLGPGVYPVDRVPAPPHPFDRCNREPVFFEDEEIGEDKPDPDRVLGSRDVKIRGRMTDKRRQRIIESAERAIVEGESAAEEAIG